MIGVQLTPNDHVAGWLVFVVRHPFTIVGGALPGHSLGGHFSDPEAGMVPRGL